MRNPVTTLCYIEKDDCYLMLHRVKKENDINKDKWIGVGGHAEKDESPDECLLREVKEEIGLDVQELEFIKTYPYEKKEMLMLGFKAKVKKADFVFSQEVDTAKWFPFEEALANIREGSIAWQLVKAVIES